MLGNSTQRLYMVFPSYLRHSRSLSECAEDVDLDLECWAGFAGGGVLSHRCDLPQDASNDLQSRFAPWAGVKYPYGTALGNAEAMRLREYVHVVQSDEWIPDLLLRMGATKSAEPQVKMTIEHLDGIGNQIHLLVVPKRRSKLVPMLGRLNYWFGSFKVRVSEAHGVTEEFRSRLSTWFGDPDRRMYSCSLSGGRPKAPGTWLC